MKMTIDHILDLIEQLPKNEEFDYVSGGESKAKQSLFLLIEIILKLT